MLEVKNLVKVYKTKGGVETKALDGVSVNFPETGLVFLLGKSGSGKSTLLNMIGGLDRPDSGEIIVKGRSSKDFSQADFDSYRNTFIGFIFQEYNVLNEFNIEQNIALALQLQGKKNDKDAVNKLLEEVDLEGFNKRKPNTLSGGQKQRIAIARALIKQPEIIMADEPTGALDSNTGKQVLETLKKLSKTKLVIIVSHDQDFAEEYGDRIIELKDGKIISDKSKELVPPKAINEKMQIINGNIIDIKKGSALTEADFKQLYQLIKKQDKEVLISTGEESIKTQKKAMRISHDGKGERFSDTKQVEVKKYDGKQTKFIRSHMPFSRSFKMGASSLKTKPIRLIFTILLSVVSFTMFGVSSTLMFYNESYSLSAAMEKSDRTSEAVAKKYSLTQRSYKINKNTGEKTENGSAYTRDYFTYFGANELKTLNEANNNRFIGVFNLDDFRYDRAFSSGSTAFPFAVGVTGDAKDYCFANYFSGLSDAPASFFSDNSFTLVGNHPTTKEQIAISKYHYELLKESGSYEGVASENDILNKKLTISVPREYGGSGAVELTITGVYNFGDIPAGYNALKDKKADSVSENDREALKSNFKAYIDDSFHTIGYVAPAFYDEYGFVYNDANQEMGRGMNQYYLNGYIYLNYEPNPEDFYGDGSSVYLMEDLLANNQVEYYNTSFEKVSNPIQISDDEVLLPYSYYNYARKQSLYDFGIRNKKEALSTVSDDAHITELNDFLNDIADSGPHTEEASQAYYRVIENCYSDTYPEGHDIDEDLATVNARFTELYNEAIRRYYYHQYHSLFMLMGLPDYDTKVQDYINKIYDDTITAAELDTLGSNLEEYASAYPEAKRYVNAYVAYYASGDSFRNEIWSNVNKKYGTDTSQVFNDYRDNPTDPVNAERLDYLFTQTCSIVYGKDIDPESFNYNNYPLANYVDKYGRADFYSRDNMGNVKHHTVKGFFGGPAFGKDIMNNCAALNRNVVSNYIEGGKGGDDYTYETVFETNYVSEADAKYSFILSATHYSKEDISLFNRDNTTYKYTMTNSRFALISQFTSMINELKTIFLIIGAVTGGLAALLLLNFISVSITSKNKDIGILRAVGARGSDVFKIFFSESSIIALICFILSSVGTGIVCYNLNATIMDKLGIRLLEFGVINVALILGVAIVISFIATFIPVLIASKKPPVEAIRSL